MLMAASRAQVASISAIATNRFSTCSGVAVETTAPLRGRMSINPLVVSCRSASRTGVRDTPCCCARLISSSRMPGFSEPSRMPSAMALASFSARVGLSGRMPVIAYKIGAKANNCSFNAQIECNPPKLHTIRRLPARVQGGCRTGFDMRKSPPNQASQALENRMAYRLLPPSQAAPGRHHRGGNIMIDKFTIGRRGLLGGVAGMAAFGLTGTARAQKPLVIGFIYVGSRDDYGYNQAHAAGAAVLKKMPGLKVVEEEKVPETDAVEKTMESMINLDGATLLFPTSFGYYSPHMIKIANKFPKLHFEHCGGLWTDKDPKNAGSYFGYIDEAQFVSGIVAGYSSKTGKLGFVAAKPIPQVLRNINAFTLGARLANPKATTQVIFTGDWSMPVKEAEATNSLIDQGVDVLTCHVDGPKTMVENAARRGAMVCGYHVNQSP